MSVGASLVGGFLPFTWLVATALNLPDRATQVRVHRDIKCSGSQCDVIGEINGSMALNVHDLRSKVVAITRG